MPISGKQLIKELKKEGWVLDRVNGSHHILTKGKNTITVPVHGNKSLGKGIEQKLFETGKAEEMIYYAKLTKQGRNGYLVEFPELPGCLTEGKTVDMALHNAKEALDGWLASNCGRSLHVPTPKERRGSTYYPVEVDLCIAFAIMLRRARLKRKLTQAQVAKKLGVSQQAYAKLELPNKTNPSLSTVQKIIEVLELNWDFQLVA